MTCAGMTPASPAAIASRYGAASLRRISATGRSSRGTATCESSAAKPWPGKCLPTAATPPSASPCTIRAARAPRFPRRVGVAVPETAEPAHRRDRGEALAEALHAAALVVYAHQQRRLAQPGDLLGQSAQLLRALVVAREQDHRAHRGMREAPAGVLRERAAPRAPS